MERQGVQATVFLDQFLSHLRELMLLTGSWVPVLGHWAATAQLCREGTQSDRSRVGRLY